MIDRKEQHIPQPNMLPTLRHLKPHPLQLRPLAQRPIQQHQLLLARIRPRIHNHIAQPDEEPIRPRQARILAVQDVPAARKLRRHLQHGRADGVADQHRPDPQLHGPVEQVRARRQVDYAGRQRAAEGRAARAGVAQVRVVVAGPVVAAGEGAAGVDGGLDGAGGGVRAARVGAVGKHVAVHRVGRVERRAEEGRGAVGGGGEEVGVPPG